jgi:glucose/arabinose dehydrogenase
MRRHASSPQARPAAHLDRSCPNPQAGRPAHPGRRRPTPRPRPGAAALAALCLAAAGVPAPASADALAPGAPAGIEIRDWATGLGQVTDLAFLPDGSAVIVEKGGAVRLRSASGALSPAGSFPVDTESEKGLLGVAVDPAFATTRRLFFYYSAANGAGGTDLDRHRVVSVTLVAGGTLDAASETVLVRGLRGPANHDGGGLAIGPDGRLYVGVGDTGCNSGAAPGGTITNWFGTCLTNGNGKILRVGLDGSIPADNPLAGVASATACGDACGVAISPASLAAPRPDLWAWGFRNPYRLWFDPATGNLWVGDVGEVSYEEIDVVRGGRHHGWPFREGAFGHAPARCREVVPDTGDCVDPVYTCSHGSVPGVDGGCGCVVGGAIADAAAWPDGVRGRYVFGDCTNGRIWSLALNAARDGAATGTASPRADLATVSGTPTAIRPGPDGALYVAVLGGRIARIGAPAGGSPPPVPAPAPPSGCACAGAPTGAAALAVTALLPFVRRRRAGGALRCPVDPTS